MSIISQLTLRHLRLNRRRTLITVLGAIISVAMLTAVATLGVSFLDLMRRQTIASNGEWHVAYRAVSSAQLQTIRDDSATRTLAVSRDLGYARLAGSQNRFKPYLFVKALDTRASGQFPVELVSGRLPRNRGEVAISEAIARNAKVALAVGELITLELGQRQSTLDKPDQPALDQIQSLQTREGQLAETLVSIETRTFTIVGVIRPPDWEMPWSPGYTVISHIDEGLVEAGEAVDAAVVLKSVRRPLYAHARSLAKANGIARVDFNNALLRYYGVTDNDNLRRTLYSLCAIIMSIVVVGSVSLIHNAFAISVSERARHLGMLASIGATRRQKRNSVLFEGVVIGLVSIPAGLLAGLGGLAVTFRLINGVIEGALGIKEQLTVTVTPLSLATAASVAALTILVSAWLPARKAARISAMDAIRQSADIKLAGKAVRTSALVRRLFGMEADLGLKNLKRNRRRYQATVFSMVISIVLFLTVSFFTSGLTKSLRMSQDGINYDISVQIQSREASSAARLVEQIAAFETVTASSVVREWTASVWLDEASMPPKLREQIGASLPQDGRFECPVTLHALDPQSLSAFAREAGVSEAALNDPREPAAIVIGTIVHEDVAARQFVETESIVASVGQRLELFRIRRGTEGTNGEADETDREAADQTPIGAIRIAALTGKVPMGVFPAGLGGVSAIVSEQTLAKLVASHAAAAATTAGSPAGSGEGTAEPFPGELSASGIDVRLLLNSADPMATQEAIEALQEDDLHVRNIYRSRQQEAQMLLLMSVFTYGFIVLITTITLANMLNTISTSVSLRKREFAMLRSVGMTPQGFGRMMRFESVFYGFKALVWGLPLSIGVMALIHRSLASTFSYRFTLPWRDLLIAVIAVLAIVSTAMLYASARMKRENIIDALKQESI